MSIHSLAVKHTDVLEAIISGTRTCAHWLGHAIGTAKDALCQLVSKIIEVAVPLLKQAGQYCKGALSYLLTHAKHFLITHRSLIAPVGISAVISFFAGILVYRLLCEEKHNQ